MQKFLIWLWSIRVSGDWLLPVPEPGDVVMKFLKKVAVLGAACMMFALMGCGLLAPVLLTMDMLGVDDKNNIQYHFEKDANRVAVVCHLGKHHHIDVGHFDRDVNTLLSPLIAAYTKKKPEIVLAARVHRWMDEHQDWKSPYEIGQALNVDYVVFIELRRIGFYEKEGWKQFYKGTCDASVSIHRIGTETENEQAVPVWGPNSYSFKFPPGMRPLSDSEVTLTQFRELFVRHVAERLSWIFVPHASSREYSDEKQN
ncbi:MAG TPA: hypothetical protein PKA06_07185 [Gemmatales bacterium]|nr:hypothetical protein [Gemmatales bacterium]